MITLGIGEAAALATAISWSASCLIHAEASSRLGATSMLLVRTPRSAQDFQELIGALVRQDVSGAGGILTLHTSRLKVSCDKELAWTLDGEYGGDHQAVEIKVCKRAVEIVHGA